MQIIDEINYIFGVNKSVNMIDSICPVNKSLTRQIESCDWPSSLNKNWIQIMDFLVRVTLKLDGWPPKQ